MHSCMFTGVLRMSFDLSLCVGLDPAEVDLEPLLSLSLSLPCLVYLRLEALRSVEH